MFINTGENLEKEPQIVELRNQVGIIRIWVNYIEYMKLLTIFKIVVNSAE